MERHSSVDPHAPRRSSNSRAKHYDFFLNIVQSIRKGELLVDDAFQAGCNPVDLTRFVSSDRPHDPDSRVIRQQNLALVNRVLSSLQKREREALVRFYVEDQTIEQICREMKLTPTKFRLIKTRAKARFVELSRLELTPGSGHSRETKDSAADCSPAIISKSSSQDTRAPAKTHSSSIDEDIAQLGPAAIAGGARKEAHTDDAVLAHVFETFGSKEKAKHWLHRQNHVFQGRTPLEVIESDPEAVEIELTRTDHGVYI